MPCFFDISLAFLVIPFEAHTPIVKTKCSYVNSSFSIYPKIRRGNRRFGAAFGSENKRYERFYLFLVFDEFRAEPLSQPFLLLAYFEQKGSQDQDERQ